MQMFNLSITDLKLEKGVWNVAVNIADILINISEHFKEL